jgi:hypothetical protein
MPFDSKAASEAVKFALCTDAPRVFASSVLLAGLARAGLLSESAGCQSTPEQQILTTL